VLADFWAEMLLYLAPSWSVSRTVASSSPTLLLSALLFHGGIVSPAANRQASSGIVSPAANRQADEEAIIVIE
jgi:hypothetical protein